MNIVLASTTDDAASVNAAAGMVPGDEVTVPAQDRRVVQPTKAVKGTSRKLHVLKT